MYFKSVNRRNWLELKRDDMSAEPGTVQFKGSEGQWYYPTPAEPR